VVAINLDELRAEKTRAPRLDRHDVAGLVRFQTVLCVTKSVSRTHTFPRNRLDRTAAAETATERCPSFQRFLRSGRATWCFRSAPNLCPSVGVSPTRATRKPNRCRRVRPPQLQASAQDRSLTIDDSIVAAYLSSRYRGLARLERA
jgi:hypothetical protein